MANVLLSVNSYNRFGGGAYFPKWWEHIEKMVIEPYRDMLDVALYDDGSDDDGMVDYLIDLRRSGRVDWLTLGPERNARLPLARHAFGNVGYAYSLSGWPEHEFILHFDTDIWFVRPDEDKGFDWLNACIDRLRGSEATFATSLWGCLWSNGASYRDDRPPSWFHLRWEDPTWVESSFFSTRMFLARTADVARNSEAALTEIGRPGLTRNNRRGLVGKLDSYERLVNKNEIYAKRRHAAFLRRDSGVVTLHIDWLKNLAWAKRRLGVRAEANINRVR